MAQWETMMTQREKEELDRARRARNATAEVLRELTKTLKARCIKRLNRSKEKKVGQ